jgi:hypothetical protein
MPSMSVTEIQRLCDEWCAASTTPQGGMVIGRTTEQFRLLANGIEFHELSFDQLCWALTSLTKVLLRRGMNTVVDQDHLGAWSWCGELLVGARAGFFSPEQQEIKALFETALHAALANSRRPPRSKEDWKAQNRIDEQQPHHSQQLLRNTPLVLAYISLPLLEAVLKLACKAYVSTNGVVTTQFDTPRQNGTGRKIYDVRHRCSSLRDLLYLHHERVAAPALRAHLDKFRDHLAYLDNSQDPFDLIYTWRNDSLHGSANYQTIGGTILGLTLIVALFALENDFEAQRQAALENYRWESTTGRKSPWSFYPPY